MRSSLKRPLPPFHHVPEVWTRCGITFMAQPPRKLQPKRQGKYAENFVIFNVNSKTVRSLGKNTLNSSV